MQAKLRINSKSPKDAKSKISDGKPIRTKDLTDGAEPEIAASKTDELRPKRARPKAKGAEPERPWSRENDAESMCTRSETNSSSSEHEMPEVDANKPVRWFVRGDVGKPKVKKSKMGIENSERPS